MGEEMTLEEKVNEVARLRNRHVAKLLTFIGDPPPYLSKAIKTAFSMFEADINSNILGIEGGEGENRGNRAQE